MQLPTIEITFKELANTLVARSERGIGVLLLQDGSGQGLGWRLYQSQRELVADKGLYTPENYQYVNDALAFSPARLYVLRLGAADEGAQPPDIPAALRQVENLTKTGWVTLVGEAADYVLLSDWVKEQRLLGRTYKGITWGQAPDSRGLVDLGIQTVTFRDGRGEQPGKAYLPSLLGLLAACNIKRGSTNFICENLLSVQEPADIPGTLDAGKLVLVNDYDTVRVGLGINSLTTLTGGNTQDMKYIDIVETMDLIADDIREAFKETYQGAYKNSLDNQMLFISAVNTYFEGLERNGVLDNLYQNSCQVDVQAQREAWARIKPEAEAWDDATVRNTTYKRDVFLAGDIKILGAMESLKFDISMF